MAPQIPRRIIQTDKTVELPLFNKAAVVNVRMLNPDFEYRFFDDAAVEAFIDTEFPQYRSVFDAFPVRIQRYDFFRYLAVYKLGGFYFDTDVLLAKGLEDLLGRSCVFPFEELSCQRFFRDAYDLDWEIGNYAFAASEGHAVIGAIIDNCIRAQREPSWVEQTMSSIPRFFRKEFYVYNTTGPGLVTRTLAEFPDAANAVSVLFPDDVRDTTKWHCFGDYGVHVQAGSWRQRRGLVYRRAFRAWESRVRRSIARDSERRGPTRSLQFRIPE
jgi:mannosyltransferase OCH1-like enzyme